MALAKVFKLVGRILIDITVVAAILLLLPGLPPYVRFESYSLPPPLELKGPLEINSLLESAIPLLEGQITGPESIATRNNEIYTGLILGDIVRIKNGQLSVVVKGHECDGKYRESICGRPLGMRFDSNGKLIVVNCYFGVFKVDVDTGNVETLVNSTELIDGKRPFIPNDLDVGKDGTIYWSDSSTTATLQDSLIEFLGEPTGRLIKYDPRTKESSVLIKDLQFANGVQLSKNEDFVVVAECARSRVWKYFLTGPKKGQHEILIDNLPGSPDNIRSDRKGGFLISLIVTRTSERPSPVEMLGPYPLLRKFILRMLSIAQVAFGFVDSIIPNEFAGKAAYYINHLEPFASFAPKHSIVVHLDENGKLIGSFHSTKHGMTHISEMSIDENRTFAYLGSPYNTAIWRVKVKDLKI